ncbi:MAG: U3 small nucleolar RNA-associated protein 13 [Caeruleum heppii]|nr:MAG: U3 small nucleolar RNA-associated protein 13 [Caeruleum heppii]
MLSRSQVKTTYEPQRVIQPIFTGGSLSLDASGRILATTLGEDAILTDLETGEQLARIEGDDELLTALALTPSASHLVLCSRSFSLRIYSLRRQDSSSFALVPELQRTFKPHDSPVITLTTDSTGTLLATGGSDGLVKVWDIRGGYNTHTLRGHSGIISALRFFEVDVDQRQLQNGTSLKYTKKNRRKDRPDEDKVMLDVDGDDGNTIKGFRLASGSENGHVRVWDLHTRKCMTVLDSHVSVVRDLDYSPEENALVSASRDKTIIIWDARTWKARKVIPVLEGVESVGFVENGRFIYTGGEKGRVRMWETENGREVTQEQEAGSESEAITDIVFHSGLTTLLSVHGDQSLLFHSLDALSDFTGIDNLAPLPLIRRISGTHDEIIDLAYLTPSRSLLALATNSEDLRLISVATSPDAMPAPQNNQSPHFFGADVSLLRGHKDIIICLDADWSGSWLATGAKDNTARLWRIDPSTSSYTCFATFTGHAESLGAIALPRSSPPVDSSAYQNPLHRPPPFLLTGSQDRTIKRWSISSETPTSAARPSKAIYTRKAHDKDINALDTNHDSTLFASASQDRTVKIWSVEEGEVQGILRGHRRGVWSVKFSPRNCPSINGDNGPSSSSQGFVLTGSGDKTVKIWSLADYSCLLTLEGHTNSILKVLWLSPSSGRAAPTRSLTVNGEEDENEELHHPPPTSAVQIASAGSDGLVKIWDPTSGSLACTLDNHTDRIWSLAYDPRTSTLLSGGADSVLTFWKDTTTATAAATTARATQRVEQEQQLQNHIHQGQYRDAIVLALQLNHPGRLLRLFTDVVGTIPPEGGSLSGVLAVDEVLRSLHDEQLFTLLCRIRDWNTNARTSPVAQRILWVILRSYPAETFVRMAKHRRGGGLGKSVESEEAADGSGRVKTKPQQSMKEMLDALRAYTERHYRRMDELLNESYLVDFTLREMDQIGLGI